MRGKDTAGYVEDALTVANTWINNASTTLRARSIFNIAGNNDVLAEAMRIESDNVNPYVSIAGAVSSSTFTVNGSVSFKGISYVQTASLGGGALLAGACSSVTTTSSGLSSTTAIVTTPQSDPGDGFSWNSIVMASTSIKTRVCAAVAGTPTASLYNLKIIN
jgi:hypothetical protein